MSGQGERGGGGLGLSCSQQGGGGTSEVSWDMGGDNGDGAAGRKARGGSVTEEPGEGGPG